MTCFDIKELIAENARRNAAIRAEASYNPLAPDNIPDAMMQDARYMVARNEHDLALLRFKYDFEFWACKCVVITDKVSSQDIPFRLNRPQRRLVAELERQRLAGEPLRLIMLKARQWGGSTLVQVYFAWIQIIHCRNWNSLICAHVKDSAATIRGMYSKILERYPEEYWEEESPPAFRPFERMTNTRYIPGRGCKVTVCSSENQESTRGMDCSLAHLSEVAFWKDSPLHNPEDLLRSVASGVARKPLSFIAMESTANGVGNFFHREWMRAVSGKSDKIPFFVPWHEIDMYAEEVADAELLWNSLDEYERELWHTHGCTLEAINWYHNKRRGFPDHRSMMAEYPTTPDEAFTSSSTNVFASVDVERLRCGVREPLARGEIVGSPKGDMAFLSSPRFVPSPEGGTMVWMHPVEGERYIVSVDIGGRSRHSDYSVIAVLTLGAGGALPEVVAQWRGHIDHDLLGFKAAAMGRYYNDALLVVESNTWETSSEGHGAYILNALAENYPNLYRRGVRTAGSSGEDSDGKPGFHTNIRTKAALIANLIAMVREGGYIERDNDACDELLQYEALPDGSYSARRGCHDDILMTRAIALYVGQVLQGPHDSYLIDSGEIDRLLSMGGW
jgi:hypothetical protein